MGLKLAQESLQLSMQGWAAMAPAPASAALLLPWRDAPSMHARLLPSQHPSHAQAAGHACQAGPLLQRPDRGAALDPPHAEHDDLAAAVQQRAERWGLAGTVTCACPLLVL